MEISQGALAWLYFYALLLGIALGGVYDALRITRVFLGVHYSRRTARRLRSLRLPLLPPAKDRKESCALGIVIFFEDLLFCIFSGVCLVLLFYAANNGNFRFFALLIVGIGFLLYRGTLGRLVTWFSETIAFVIETVFRYLAFFIMFPLRLIWNVIKKYTTDVILRIRSAIERNRRCRFTSYEGERLQRNACGLIPDALPRKRILKRGRTLGKRKKKTVFAHTSRTDSSCRSGGGVDRSVCK